MRKKYLKPAYEMEEFDLEDVITLSTQTQDVPTGGPTGQELEGDPDIDIAAPVDLINLN